MEKETKSKATVGLAVGAGAGILGFIQGAGVDHILTDKIIDSLKSGDIKSTAAFIAIFLLIWLQVKGVRTEVKEVRLALTSPDAPIAVAFAKGEKRMEAIEKQHSDDHVETLKIFQGFEHRLTVMEESNKSQGGNYGQSPLHT